VKRVVLLGSESTGKTTLAERLARHYGVSWVPEFVREYASGKGSPLEASDVDAVARGQVALEDDYLSRAAAADERLLIGDTDLLSTAVYAAHYYGRVAAWVEESARERRPDLYLLLDVDLPWVPDPQRDRGHLRGEMHALFRDAAERSGVPFVVISGDAEARFAVARAAIDGLLSSS
jgi:NadR type nicotinamide-nucleotide adenylyltransferase